MVRFPRSIPLISCLSARLCLKQRMLLNLWNTYLSGLFVDVLDFVSELVDPDYLFGFKRRSKTF